MSATDCLSHDWLRRRNTESSCNDLVTAEQQLNANGQRGNELEYQRDTLRNIVDRWNDDAHVISVPAIANGESKKVSKGDKSKLTETTAANPEVKTNQPGHKPKTKITKTKKTKKKDAPSTAPSKETPAAESTEAANIADRNLVKPETKDDTKSNENLVNEEKKVKKKKKACESVINSNEEQAPPVPASTADTNCVEKKTAANDGTTTEVKTVKKHAAGQQLKDVADRSHARVNGEESPRVEKGESTPETKLSATTTELCSNEKPAPQRNEEIKSVDSAFTRVSSAMNELQTPTTEPANRVEEIRKSLARKTSSSTGSTKKTTRKSASPDVARKLDTGHVEPNKSQSKSTTAAKSAVEEERRQRTKPATNLTETAKSMLTNNSSNEGVSPDSKSPSKVSRATESSCGNSIQVEISDESYNRIKKCTFIIKNITECSKSVNANTSAHSSSSASDEEAEEPLGNVTLRRRISDITSLLSQDHTNRLADEIANVRNNLTQLRRNRQDNLSKSLSCGESGNFTSKRPKFRISCFSRDVPLASPLTNCHNLTNLSTAALNGEDAQSAPWSRRRTTNHSDPSSLRTSPEPYDPPSLTRKILSRFFSETMDYDLSAGVPSPSPNSMTKDKLTELILPASSARED